MWTIGCERRVASGIDAMPDGLSWDVMPSSPRVTDMVVPVAKQHGRRVPFVPLFQRVHGRIN